MTKSTIRTFMILSLFVVVLLTACGPSVDPAAIATTPVEPDNAIPFIGDSAPLEATAVDTPLPAGSTDVDAVGISVGYTAEGRPYRGNPDAAIVMEAFSDYQCPYCSRFTKETMPGLLENQIAAGDVLLVFYDFPLNSIHPQAAAAANAARCAGESGAAAFWAMHDRLFADIGEWSNNRANEIFRQYGEELGIANEGFATCLEENRYADAIDADLALGQSRGVGSTPSFFLNDQPVIGAYPLDYFNQAIAAVAAGEIVAGAPDSQPQAPAIKPTPATIFVDDIAGQKGDPDAPVTIVEYTDYQCPYCNRYAVETLPQIIINMIDTGRVHYMVKDFPLDSIHPEARAAAVAARCAGDQDAYWEMHDELFAQQAAWGGLGSGANDVFASMASDLGLDVDEFSACLTSGFYDEVIHANQDEGLSLGVRGTPAFFIDGFPISGAQPYDLFDYAVGLAEDGTLADAYAAPAEQQADPPPSGPVEVNTDGAYSIGDADAPVVLVEFTDFQCPFCSRHYLQTYPQIKAEYVDTGKVRYVFMDFPLSSIHPQAQLAAEAARCAGDQDAYVAMHDILFARQDAWNGREDAGTVFTEFAGEIGIDTASFATCLESREHEAAVLADQEQGISLGVDGTPAFFLNGNFISGAQPYDVFQRAIENLLADNG